MSGQLIYRKGNLFEALKEPKPVLVHAVNTQGVWGAGIALELRERFPVAFWAYKQQCDDADGSLVGEWGLQVVSFHESLTSVAWLFTAVHMGHQNDPQQVANSTENAIRSLLMTANSWTDTVLPVGKHTFHSPRINSGLFGVPWELTEAAIKRALENSRYDWNVWTL